MNGCTQRARARDLLCSVLLLGHLSCSACAKASAQPFYNVSSPNVSMLSFRRRRRRLGCQFDGKRERRVSLEPVSARCGSDRGQGVGIDNSADSNADGLDSELSDRPPELVALANGRNLDDNGSDRSDDKSSASSAVVDEPSGDAVRGRG